MRERKRFGMIAYWKGRAGNLDLSCVLFLAKSALAICLVGPAPADWAGGASRPIIAVANESVEINSAQIAMRPVRWIADHPADVRR